MIRLLKPHLRSWRKARIDQPDPGEHSSRHAPELHVEGPAFHPLVRCIALKSGFRHRQELGLLLKLLSQSEGIWPGQRIRHRDSSHHSRQYQASQRCNCLLRMPQRKDKGQWRHDQTERSPPEVPLKHAQKQPDPGQQPQRKTRTQEINRVAFQGITRLARMLRRLRIECTFRNELISSPAINSQPRPAPSEPDFSRSCP